MPRNHSKHGGDVCGGLFSGNLETEFNYSTFETLCINYRIEWLTDKCDCFPVKYEKKLSTTISLCDYFALPRYIVMLSKIQFIIFSFLWLIQSHNNFGVANRNDFRVRQSLEESGDLS